jgi:hypothetical protein
VAVAGTTYALLRPAAAAVPTAGTVARIDGDRFQAPVRVGTFPVALAAGNGRLWVMDRQSQVFSVDLSDLSTTSRGTTGIPTGAAYGNATVWITNGFAGTVSALAGDQLANAFETPVDAQAVTFGAGAVWVASPNTATILRYDTVGKTSVSISLPAAVPTPQPDSIAFGTLGGEAVWVGDSMSNTVFRVQAEPPYRVQSFTVGGPPSAIAVGSNTIWVASETADAVYELDPSSGGMRTTIDVGAKGCNAPVAVTEDVETLWVACSLSQQVLGIDRSAGSVLAHLQVTGEPDALVKTSDGSVWAAVRPR